MYFRIYFCFIWDYFGTDVYIWWAALAVGQSQRMLDIATDYALERKQFGKPIGEHQLVQAMLADCQAELHAARACPRNGRDVPPRG